MATSEKADIEAILDAWAQKPNSPESNLAEIYNHALQDFDNQQKTLLKHIRPQKTNGKLIPIFSEGSTQSIIGFDEAEKRLNEIQADINAYLALTDGQPSISLLTDKLFRARRQIAEASIESRRSLEQAMKSTNASSMEEIESLPAVQMAMDKKDETLRLLGPLVENLQSRISKAKAILDKYNCILP